MKLHICILRRKIAFLCSFQVYKHLKYCETSALQYEEKAREHQVPWQHIFVVCHQQLKTTKQTEDQTFQIETKEEEK